MTLSNIGNDIFMGDSAATSHMTNNKTGVYDLTPIRGSVMIGNGESISCTHKGKLDVICKHRDGSMARETWDMKIVPQLNHDLFSFTKAMKEGWQMNGRWKEGGLMIELLKTTRASMKFDIEWVYHNDPIVDAVEDEPLSLFGSLEVAPDGSIAKEAIGSRMYQIDAALYNELEHHALMYNLKEHV